MNIKHFLNLAIITLLAACSSYKISNFDEYKSVKMTAEDNGSPLYKKKSIVVMPFDNTGEYATRHQIGETMANLITQQIEINKYGKVEDRTLLAKLKDEIAVHEMNAKPVDFSGPAPADYVVTGNINYAIFSQSTKIDLTLLALKILNQGKGDAPISLPASNVQINASMKVLELPSMNSVLSLNCKESVTRKVPNDTYSSMVNDGIAMKRAIARCADKLMTNLVTKIKPYGFISEKKVLGSKAIFKIDIGSDSGLLPGQTVSLKRLTDGKEKKIPVTSAIISDQLEESSAWIVLGDSDEIAKIKLGDTVYVDIKYSNIAQGRIADALGLDSD